MPKIHRCRLYRVQLPSIEESAPKEYSFFEAWDTVQEPYESTPHCASCGEIRDLPDGKLLLAVEDADTQAIRRLLDKYEEMHGIVIANSWGFRGI